MGGSHLAHGFFDLPETLQDLERRLRALPYPAGFRPFKDVEADAVTLKLYEPLLVPGVVQSEDYMREVFNVHPDVTPAPVDERTTGRLDRQKTLGRRRPRACGSSSTSTCCGARSASGRSWRVSSGNLTGLLRAGRPSA
jgi:hypothetical protein